MRKFQFAVIFSTLLTISFISFQSASGQTQNTSSRIESKTQDDQKESDSNFYSAEFLKSDFKQVDVVLYVNVKSRELVDQIGGGNCEQSKGGGYCLYVLKAEVKEIYKGKVNKENFSFYQTTDADYKNKDWFLGEKVVFLKRGDNYPNKKMSLGTLENSTREIKYDVIEKMRKIAKTSSNKKK